ncbi:light-harvesting antenna LH1, beta subunit [Lamprobacter modestohalophilus]
MTDHPAHLGGNDDRKVNPENDTEVITMADNKSLTGLTETEAQEFHGIFMSSFSAFVGVAAFAHLLAWFWRPWL